MRVSTAPNSEMGDLEQLYFMLNRNYSSPYLNSCSAYMCVNAYSLGACARKALFKGGAFYDLHKLLCNLAWLLVGKLVYLDRTDEEEYAVRRWLS